MRQLSKIVFVNSAGIRYGEVQLDGNVHLIGTQGVGKSTVLRAILFFYTGDKTHLGISREKKSFDDFYLPGANSYIAYEVESEFGAFTVLVFRSHAHSVFRFIGAPFRREWLIDGAGEVEVMLTRKSGPAKFYQTDVETRSGVSGDRTEAERSELLQKLANEAKQGD